MKESFPTAYMDIDAKKRLRVVITHASDDVNAPSVADIVEKIFDKTQCDLGLQFQPEAQKQGHIRRRDLETTTHFVTGDDMDGPVIKADVNHGMFYTADIVISLERAEPHSLMERSVMDVVERKLQQEPRDEHMASYLPIRSEDGTKLTVSHLTEMSPTKEDAQQVAAAIMAHCKQKLGVPSADIKLIGMEGDLLMEGSEEKPDFLPKDPTVITLSGTEDALTRAQHNLRHNIDMEMEFTPAKKGKLAQLQISKVIQTGHEAIGFLSQVHMATGCELPIRLQNGTSCDTPEHSQEAPSTYQPAVLLWFEDAQARYSDLMIQTVARYVSSHIKGKQEFQFPVVSSADGDVYDLDQPVALIHEKAFKAHERDGSKHKAQEDADGEAKNMVAGLTSILEFKKPAKGRAA